MSTSATSATSTAGTGLHAHLLPLDAPVPEGALTSCRLRPLHDAGPEGRQLVLTTDPTAPYVVESTPDLHPDRAAVAVLVEFHGPRTEAFVAAQRRADRERVAPAAASVPGTGGAVVLRAADGGSVAVAFADSAAALEAAGRAITSTPLLPGEDPALLTGPDRLVPCAADAGPLVEALLASTLASTAAAAPAS